MRNSPLDLSDQLKIFYFYLSLRWLNDFTIEIWAPLSLDLATKICLFRCLFRCLFHFSYHWRKGPTTKIGFAFNICRINNYQTSIDSEMPLLPFLSPNLTSSTARWTSCCDTDSSSRQFGLLYSLNSKFAYKHRIFPVIEAPQAHLFIPSPEVKYRRYM